MLTLAQSKLLDLVAKFATILAVEEIICRMIYNLKDYLLVDLLVNSFRNSSMRTVTLYIAFRSILYPLQ